MTKKLVTSYTFTPGGSGVGTVAIAGTYALEQFLLITNVVDNIVIYEFDVNTLGGTVSTGSGNTTLTLTYNTSGMSSSDRLQIFIDDGQNPTVSVSGTTAVSATALPLPTGAATAAKQPALGTAGVASTDVITVQGIASGTPQPISGTVTVNAGTNLNTSALALESGGNLDSINTKLPSLDTGYVPVLVKNGQLEIQNDTGNPIPVGPAAQLNVTGSASALNGVLFSTACDAYRSINIQITGTWVGTITFQVSNDNSNWATQSILNSVGSTTTVGNATTNSCFYGTLGGFQYFRAIFTAYTSGTATANAYLAKEIVATPVNTNGAIVSVSSFTANTTSSATTLYTVNSAASTNAASIKATGANLYGISVMNTSAATKYVRLFNLTVAPTVGTSVPIMVVAVPATSSKEIQYVPAVRFGTGLSVAITGGAAATDSTAVAAGDVQLLVSYA